MLLAQYPAALRRFVNELHAPWSKPETGNFLRLATAFLRRRSLPIRRLARAVTGPYAACRKVDRQFCRFLASKHFDTAGTLTAYLKFLLPRLGAVPFISVALDGLT